MVTYVFVVTYASDAWALLGDPSRRTIIERLSTGPCTVTELAGAMRISRPAVSQHLKLLKDVRASTLVNKSELKSHIQIIHSVKDQLDKARRNLVSPLIRRAQSNSFGLEQQVNDLAGTYCFLKDVRDV